MTNSASTKNLRFIEQGKESRDDGFAMIRFQCAVPNWITGIQ